MVIGYRHGALVRTRKLIVHAMEKSTEVDGMEINRQKKFVFSPRQFIFGAMDLIAIKFQHTPHKRSSMDFLTFQMPFLLYHPSPQNLLHLGSLTH